MRYIVCFPGSLCGEVTSLSDAHILYCNIRMEHSCSCVCWSVLLPGNQVGLWYSLVIIVLNVLHVYLCAVYVRLCEVFVHIHVVSVCLCTVCSMLCIHTWQYWEHPHVATSCPRVRTSLDQLHILCTCTCSTELYIFMELNFACTNMYTCTPCRQYMYSTHVHVHLCVCCVCYKPGVSLCRSVRW